MKSCSKCNRDLPTSEFSKNSQQKSGLHPCCKSCRKKEYQARKRNPDWYSTYLKKSAEWRKKNHAKQLEMQRKHYQENKPLYVAKAAKRRARLKNATPRWLTKNDHRRITKEYEIAALLTEATGYSWHVDHDIPLNGNNVSGLHVPENLRVVPWFINLSKANSF